MNSRNELETPIKFSDLLSNGVTFSLKSQEPEEEPFDDDTLFTFQNHPDAENCLNLFEKSFDQLKNEDMQEVMNGVWKKVIQKPGNDAKSVDFARQRVTYHRNFYLEDSDYPFDSTILINKPDIVLPSTNLAPIGFFKAMSTMKEGEKSCFVISSELMFKEAGCAPRIPPSADILAEITILKIDEIGDQHLIEALEEKEESVQHFKDLQQSIEECRLRAKDDFKSQNGFNSAVKMYKKLLEKLNFCILDDKQDKEECNKLKALLLKNLAICSLKKNKAKEALQYIADIESLANIDQNAKVLFCKAKAFRMTGDLDNAKMYIKKAYKLNQCDDILKEMEILESYIENDKELNSKLAENLVIKD